MLHTDNDGDGVPSPGDVIEYTIEITNSGNAPATNVNFTDTPDANSALVVGSVTASQGTISAGNTAGDTEVAVNMGTLDPGAANTVTITFQVTIDDPLPAGVTSIANQGLVTSDETADEPTDDPETTQDDDPTESDITDNDPDFDGTNDVIKSDVYHDNDNSASLTPGDVIDYTITIHNSGQGQATNVVYADNIPANTELVTNSITTTKGSITSTDPVTIEIGTMAPDETVTIEFSVQVTQSALQIENQGLVSNDDTPDEPTDDPDTTTEDDPTITIPRDVIDSRLVLIENVYNEPNPGEGRLVLKVEAHSRNGSTIPISIYDPSIELDSILPTLTSQSDVTFSNIFFGSSYDDRYTPTPHYDETSQRIHLGWEYNSSGSRQSLDGTWTTIVRITILYTMAAEEGFIRWDDQAGYQVTDQVDDDVTGELIDSIELQNIPYPIELSSFTATVNGVNVLLQWTTQSESNNLGFRLYRSETREGIYHEITSQIIVGAGDSDQEHHYEFTDQDVESGKTYFYKLADVSFDGKVTQHNVIEVNIGLPSEFSLEQNYPNPFNPETTIRFSLTESGYVTLSIFNIKGQRVRTLVSNPTNTGIHSVVWDGRDDQGQILPSGVYIYELRTDNRVETKKMDFIK